MTLTHYSPNDRTDTVGSIGTYELAMLREMLEQQRAFRLDQLANFDSLGRRGRRAAGRPRTAADVEVERSLRDGAASALLEVERAITRMQDGSYGRCLTCEAPLELERLEILPHVALCMPCQRVRDDRP
jgi:RNA polymerase-binding transcription factor DksA